MTLVFLPKCSLSSSKKSIGERTPVSQTETTAGLGLYTIKNIFEWHDGQIWFERKIKEITKNNQAVSLNGNHISMAKDSY